MTAMVRNLATMTRVGVLAPGSAGTAAVVAQLGDGERIRRARVHPIALLAALRTYESGRRARGRHTWSPVREVVDALDAAFLLGVRERRAGGDAAPAGTRCLGLDDRRLGGRRARPLAARCLGRPRARDGGDRGAVRGRRLPRRSRRLEVAHKGPWGWAEQGLSPLAISPRQRLGDAVRTVSDLPFGGTDCALPMLYAQAREREIDMFVVYTDSETWAGSVHPAQALREYRAWSGIDARLVVVGMVSNGFSIADPADPGMLDVVGFDTATPPAHLRLRPRRPRRKGRRRAPPTTPRQREEPCTSFTCATWRPGACGRQRLSPPPRSPCGPRAGPPARSRPSRPARPARAAAPGAGSNAKGAGRDVRRLSPIPESLPRGSPDLRAWRNRKTHRPQEPASLGSWGFDSLRPHLPP